MPDMREKPPTPPPRAPGADWPNIDTLEDLRMVAKNWFSNPTDLTWNEVHYMMDGIRRVVPKGKR